MDTINALNLHSFHAAHRAQFIELGREEAVANFGSVQAEHAALAHTAGVLDLSYRGRLCVTGEDRQRFLHGQVTNDVNRLQAGQGCYAALVTAKGKLVSDMNLYRLADEILLDFEPALTEVVRQRLERFVISDDVQIVEVASLYGLLSVQGPKAAAVVEQMGLEVPVPQDPMRLSVASGAGGGDIYLVNLPRLATAGFDLFVPNDAMAGVMEKAVAAAESLGGQLCGWEALETARIEAAIPRFGADMDENNLPPEAGLESRAVSYTKGCYIGQEVINRIRTLGQVARALRRLQLADALAALPMRGDALLHQGKEVGWITSAVHSPTFNQNIALGYVRKECNALGTELTLRTALGESAVQVVGLPFEQNFT